MIFSNNQNRECRPKLIQIIPVRSFQTSLLEDADELFRNYLTQNYRTKLSIKEKRVHSSSDTLELYFISNLSIVLSMFLNIFQIYFPIRLSNNAGIQNFRKHSRIHHNGYRQPKIQNYWNSEVLFAKTFYLDIEMYRK